MIQWIILSVAFGVLIYGIVQNLRLVFRQVPAMGIASLIPKTLPPKTLPPKMAPMHSVTKVWLPQPLAHRTRQSVA
jgi:hypothetical protein